MFKVGIKFSKKMVSVSGSSFSASGVSSLPEDELEDDVLSCSGDNVQKLDGVVVTEQLDALESDVFVLLLIVKEFDRFAAESDNDCGKLK